MTAFLLALIFTGGMRPVQYNVHLFWTVQECTENAMILAKSDLLGPEYDIWCYPVVLPDGFASWEN